MRLSAFNTILCGSLATLLFVLPACSDPVEAGPDNCPDGESWNPIEQVCTPGGPGGSDTGLTDDDTGDGDGGDGDGGGGTVSDCGEGNAPTRLTGVVTIPSGELPLPGAAVYIPSRNSPPPTIEVGASCVPCEEEQITNFRTKTRTNVRGEFVLTDVPDDIDVDLVIEVGKWRRQVTIPNEDISRCALNEITDPDLTRLPRNQQEGELPQFAVTTGECDALECLLRRIGISDSEFTTEDGDGRVHLFAGRGGTNSFSGGDSFTYGWDWWDDLNNLLPYDIIAHSCECAMNGGDKSQQARQALLDFTEAGGRVFLSHLHKIWLQEGPDDFKSVAEWMDMAAITGQTETGIIDTSFDKGSALREWMAHTGTTPAGEFPIQETRGSIQSLNEELAQQWVWIESEGFEFEPPPGFGDFDFDFGDDLFPDPPPELVQYFSFNTPVGAADEDQCGRAVFSDIHVSGGSTSAPTNPFPSGCATNELTPQEKALVFMLFDLSRCIVSDKKAAGL